MTGIKCRFCLSRKKREDIQYAHKIRKHGYQSYYPESPAGWPIINNSPDRFFFLMSRKQGDFYHDIRIQIGKPGIVLLEKSSSSLTLWGGDAGIRPVAGETRQ
jgi:hypothetical protein